MLQTYTNGITMKYLSRTSLVLLLATFGTLASATDTGTKLSLSMELREGETIVGKPRLIALAGERASVEVGSAPAVTGTNPSTQLGWKVDVVPTMANADEVLTNLNIKFTGAGNDGVAHTRSMSVETRQSLGKTVLFQIPGGNGQQPLSLTLRTDLVTQ